MFFLEQALSSPAIAVSRLIALIIAVIVHELGHAFAARAMGDPTGVDQGKFTVTFTNPLSRERVRLTLINPLKYFNPIGFLMFLIVGFGFLGQAPVNPNRMHNPRWGVTIAVAAGPLSNLVTAVVFALPWWLGLLKRPVPFFLIPPYAEGQVLPTLVQLGIEIILWNVLLCFFNLIPLYPLDGWTIVLGLLPSDLAYTWERYRMQSYFLFFILIFLSFVPGLPNILGILITEPTLATVRLLTRMG